MATENTTRVSIRLKTDVYHLIQKVSADAGIDPSAFMQRALERAVYDQLPPERRQELDNMETLYVAAQTKAREVFAAGGFDEHFTLTVFRELMKDQATRTLYEAIIGVDAYTSGAPRKTPLNMYLGWFIKNAVDATPLLDDAGKPRRAFIKDEPIQSYTLLTAA
ncbi:hypothetical protein [Afipia carboxidovorans]|uniref:hypothetical protein n=1 Tax=Afipia carboxidovorans TaxID=40137 RepID=UPI00308C1A5E|nr:hypothetical protein CRBSH125_21440 [Afipia carboxidovorans]